MPTLPRLPVPDLPGTLRRYLASIEPFLLEDSRRGRVSYDASYALRLRRAQDFQSGIGRVLQERLQALDSASPHNWLDDNFWIHKAYLESRAPLLINSNWWLAFHDDNFIPSFAPGDAIPHGITPWQIRRAAWLVHRVLACRAELEEQESHPKLTRTGTWLSENTSKMFNIARIPASPRDTISTPDPSSPASRKLLLMVHNFCYTVPVYRPSAERIPAPEIESQIRAVVVDVAQRLANGETPVPIGTLSADQRHYWEKNKAYLLSLSQTNQTSYRSLLNTVMGLSLDHVTHTIPSSASSAYPPPAISQVTLDAHLHTIRGHAYNFSNRFYDKTFTLIVDPAARAGASGEHAPCDALVPSIVAEYAIVQGIDEAAISSPSPPLLSFSSPSSSATDHNHSSQSSDTEPWERLDFTADAHILSECHAARMRGLALIADSDSSVLWFDGYGTDWIKGIAKLSPDAFIQMALQLAWYRTRGEFTATYETVLTRMFQRGRTETVRTFTRDSRAWVLTMIDPNTSPTTRYQALEKAIASHSRLTKEAATGRGIDRHLLGLRLMLRTQDGEHSPLFDDELFERSQTWKLSTSGLSAGHLFRGTGFGTVHNDGYGINYLAAPDMIKFGIESKFSSPLTSTHTFKEAIQDSLYEMRLICSEVVASFDFTSHL